MGLIDDIKNMKLLSNKVITNKEFNKIINNIFKNVKRKDKLLQTFEQAGATKVYKQVGSGRYEFIGFDLGTNVDKTDIKIIKSLRYSKINKKYNKVIYQREKVEQDGDDERRNAI